MKAALRHIGIVVSDLERSIEFYSNFFDFSVQKRMVETGSFISTILGLDDVNVETVKLYSKNTGSCIELLSFSTPQLEERLKVLPYQSGITHFALTVENLDQLYSKMSSIIKFISEPKVSVDGRAKVVFFHGLDGELVELVELISVQGGEHVL